MADIEGLNGGSEEANPEATKWENMDIRGQAEGEASQEVPTKASEAESVPPEDDTKAYTKDSMPTEVNIDEGASLDVDEASTFSNEQFEENKQGQNEQVSNRRLEAYEQRNNHEQSRAEKRLESYEKRLREIEEELEKASTDREELEEVLDATNGLLEENFKQHESLSTKADQLELAVKQAKRNIVSRLLRIPKAIIKAATNNNEGFFSLLEDDPFSIASDVKRGKEAQQSLNDTRKELDNNESENEELRGSREDTADQIQSINNKISRLNAEKARLEKESEELKEIVYNEGFEEAIDDATGGKGVKHAIRAEGRNILGYERNIDRLEEEKADINNLYNQETEDANAALQEAMKAYERLINMPGEETKDAERLSEQMNNWQNQAQLASEQTRKKRLDVKDVDIRKEKEAIDTALGRIKLIEGLEKSEGIKGSLARLKRKIINRLRGF